MFNSGAFFASLTLALTDSLSLGITQLASRLKTGETSPVQLVEAYLSRIAQTDGKLNAFLKVSADQARQAAKIAEDEIKRGIYKGALHGIPIGIKDLLDTVDMTTTYGSAIFRNHLPKRDATVVTRLREAGAIILGKTNLHEFALGVTNENVHFGAAKNPWAFDRIPGGSSGGSAAAVAACMCCAAIGTDTGGSIRIPSAFCGIIGLKPTYGRVSCAGVFPLAISLDHVGPMARSTADAAIMLQVMAGYDKNDPRSLMTPVPDFSKYLGDMIEKRKIAIAPDLIPEYVEPEIELAYKNAIFKIQSLGGEITESKLESKLITCRSSIWYIYRRSTSHDRSILQSKTEKIT